MKHKKPKRNILHITLLSFYRRLKVTLLLLITFCIPATAGAARLYFETPATEVGVGQEMEITLYVDSEEETINALEGTIAPPEFLKVEDIRDGDTLVAFWSERPYAQNGQIIIFGGVIPGGWSGGAGKIFSFIAKTKNQGSGMLVLSDAKVLLHDGNGTETDVSISNLKFLISNQIPISKTLISKIDDNEAPEPFTLILAQDPDVFEGGYFLVFTAQDKGSGIDYYEILETRKKLRDETKGEWQTAESPYRINDQTLESFVYIRAVDRAGNIRVAVFEPEKPAPSRTPVIILSIFFILFISTVFILYVRYKKSKIPNDK